MTIFSSYLQAHVDTLLLPDGLKVSKSNVTHAGLGVFTTKDWGSGINFGPYKGKKMYCHRPEVDVDSTCLWEVIF